MSNACLYNTYGLKPVKTSKNKKRKTLNTNDKMQEGKIHTNTYCTCMQLLQVESQT